jgi:hypothetical protein
MAPRVDRPVVRVSPPGGARWIDPQGSVQRPIGDLERHTEIVRTSEQWFLSLFKGQGARAGRPKRRQDASSPPRRAFSSAG